MESKFYLVKVGNKYVKITDGLRGKLVSDVSKCSYWTSRKTIKSWDIWLKRKFGDYKIVPGKITEA